MIPKNIKREHVIKAIEEIKRNGIPKGRDSKKFLLKFNGEYYPPKYVISLANKYANGEMLDPAQFSGGKETNNFLRNLGFDIIEISKTKRENKPSRKRERNLSNSQHDERCPKCKETIRKLLEKIYGKVEENYKFRVGTSPEDFKNSLYYSKLKTIYKKLQDHRGHRDFVKAKTLPNCDFFIPNPGFIVEFDESQHFTLPRKITLEEYPTNLELGFSKEKWIRLCEKINAKDNDPPYRDEQRAWYDTLRDFLPTILGLQPTVRLFAKDFEWCSLDPNNPEDVDKFRKMVESNREQIRVMLCVPSYSYNTEKWEKEIKEFSKKEKIDLIILPEGYIKCKFEQALEKVKNLSKKFNTAVLSGVETEEGYQIAVFYNLNPQKDETKEHIYIKHSTAYKLAYEYPEYQGKRDKMFDPILIKGRKLGVMICQDMFFPLIPHIMVKRGAEILIDLTGGNVIFQKWKNIVKGRSIENKGIFLCTMGYNPPKGKKRGQRSFCFAYDNGKVIPLHVFKDGKMKWISKFRKLPSPPFFCVISIPPDELKEEDEAFHYTNKYYSDITVSLGTGRKADIEIERKDSEFYLISNNKKLNLNKNKWVKIGNIGMLSFPLENIMDSTLILREILNLMNKINKEEIAEHYIVFYYGESELTEPEIFSLAKLRAIENRVGILVFSQTLKLALKTTKYKNIQLFQEKEGVFRLNKECLGGPMSTFTKKTIPVSFKGKYLELLREE